jgi:putative addiction module component (TIGR02574 family)
VSSEKLVPPASTPLARAPRAGYPLDVGSAAKRLLDEALQLPVEDRAELIAELIGSLEDDAGGDPNEVELAWQGEIAHRVREIDDGTAKTVPWEEVRRRLSDAARKPR